MFVRWLKFYIVLDALFSHICYGMSDRILFRNSRGILFQKDSTGHVRSPLIVAEYAPSMFAWEPSERVLMMNISNSNMIVAKYTHSYRDYVHYILNWILIIRCGADIAKGTIPISEWCIYAEWWASEMILNYMRL